MTTTIEWVPVTDLTSHPRNPRRDLGDLTELADSIRAHGVRSPLLVADRDGQHVVVAGHRRLAAARQAELVDVPCIIDPHLTETDQLELMLVENLQRSDLTPIEEAEGYQALLDEGLKVTMIAKRTGRSRSTVDSRLKLLAQPEAVRDLVHTGQATLHDASRLAAFTDEPEHDNLAAALGTSDFDWRIRNAERHRKDRQDLAKLAGKLAKLGGTIAIKEPHGYVIERSYTPGDKLPDHLPNGAVLVTSWAVHVYRPPTDEEKLKADKSAAAREKRQAKKEAEQAAAAALEDERQVAYDRRDEFVRGLLARKRWPDADTQTVLGTIAPILVYQGLSSSYEAGRWLGYDPKIATDGDYEDWLTARAFPPQALLVAALHIDVGALKWGGWERAAHDGNVVALYRMLENLGMLLSTPELARLGLADPAGEETAS